MANQRKTIPNDLVLVPDSGTAGNLTITQNGTNWVAVPASGTLVVDGDLFVDGNINGTFSFTGGVLTGDITLNGNYILDVQDNIEIKAGILANGTYVVCYGLPFTGTAFTITETSVICTDGSADIEFLINGVSLDGTTNHAAAGTNNSVSHSSDNVLAPGGTNQVTMIVTNAANCRNFNGFLTGGYNLGDNT